MSSALGNLSISQCGLYEYMYNRCVSSERGADCAGSIAVGNDYSSLYPGDSADGLPSDTNLGDSCPADSIELGAAATQELTADTDSLENRSGELGANEGTELGLAEDREAFGAEESAEVASEDAAAGSEPGSPQISEKAVMSSMLCSQRQDQLKREQLLQELGEAAPQQLRDDWEAWNKINADMEARLGVSR